MLNPRHLFRAMFPRRPSLIRPVAVVDRRTYQNALQDLQARIDAGRYAQAYHCLIAIVTWLRYEVRTGPRRHRAEYSRALTELAATDVELRGAIGLVTHG